MPNNCVLPKPCEPKEPKEPTVYPERTPSFSFCAGNKSIHWDGARLTYEPRENSIPDGTYGKLSFIDGCVVSGDECEYPTYTPPYCNDNPVPCGDGSSGGSVTISPESGNAIKNTALGLYAKTYIKSSDTAVVSGSGTKQDPYIIKTKGGSAGGSSAIIPANDSIVVDEADGVVEIGLAEQDVAGKYNGLVVNRFGIITAVDIDEEEQPITSINAGDGIAVQQLGSSATISHAKSKVGNQWLDLSNYETKLDSGGNISDIRPKEEEPDEEKIGPLLATYQAIVYPPSEVNDNGGMQEGGFIINEWGETVSYTKENGGVRKMLYTVKLPDWVDDSHTVFVNMPANYPWISTTISGKDVLITDDYDYQRGTVSYINISIRES